MVSKEFYSTNTVCIYTENLNDGVGDTVAMLKVAKELKEAVPESEIAGIILVKAGSPYEKLFSLVNENQELFKSLYFIYTDDNLLRFGPYIDLIPGDLIPGRVISNKIVLKSLTTSEELLIDDLKNAELYIDIIHAESTGTKCGELFSDFLPENCAKRRITELGIEETYSYLATNNKTDKDKILNLGLDADGVWIDNPKESTLEARAERLINLNNKKYVQMLLGKENPDKSDAMKYLQTNKYMPGYVQSPLQAMLFVMSHILKNCDENGNLKENCDFHLPKNAIDFELLKKAMQDLSLDPDLLTLASSGSPILPNTSEPKVRLITGYFLDKKDYGNIYHLASDGAACSGDNSFLQVISSENPVFVTGFGKYHHGNQFMRSFATKSLYDCLRFCTTEYAEAMLNKASEIRSMQPDLIIQDEDYVETLNSAKEIAEAMKAPGFQENYNEFRQYIINNKNVTPKFQNWVKTALKTPPDDKLERPPKIEGVFTFRDLFSDLFFTNKDKKEFLNPPVWKENMHPLKELKQAISQNELWTEDAKYFFSLVFFNLNKYTPKEELIEAVEIVELLIEEYLEKQTVNQRNEEFEKMLMISSLTLKVLKDYALHVNSTKVDEIKKIVNQYVNQHIKSTNLTEERATHLLEENKAILEQIPTKELWRLYVDPVKQRNEKEQGWVEYNKRGPNCIRRMHNAFQHCLNSSLSFENLTKTNCDAMGLEKPLYNADYTGVGHFSLEGFSSDYEPKAATLFCAPSGFQRTHYKRRWNSSYDPKDDMREMIKSYEAELKNANDNRTKLNAIVKFCSLMAKRHPFRDGNCRTFSIITLNKELISHGFSPCILDDPNMFEDCLSTDDLMFQVEKGVYNFRYLIKYGKIPDLPGYLTTIGLEELTGSAPPELEPFKLSNKAEITQESRKRKKFTTQQDMEKSKRVESDNEGENAPDKANKAEITKRSDKKHSNK